MNRSLPNYRSYLVRFWYADNAGQPVWRATVQEPGAETQLHFANPTALYTWLSAQLESDSTVYPPADNRDKTNVTYS